MVDDQVPSGPGEEFSQAHGLHRSVTGLQIGRALLEYVVVDDRAQREPATQVRDAFAVAHQLDLGPPQFLPGTDVFGRFPGETGLTHRYLRLSRCLVAVFAPAQQRMPT